MYYNLNWDMDSDTEKFKDYMDCITECEEPKEEKELKYNPERYYGVEGWF